jgi:hypothetical protein
MEASTAGNSTSPWEAHEAAGADEHPEIPVLAALAGGFVLAKVIGMIFGDDD